MSFNRRSFLIGAGSGLSLLVLTACTDGAPVPTPSPTDLPRPGAPKPSEFLRSAWTTDPFSRGSHSFMAVSSTPEHRVALRQPLAGRVFFAGEATSSEAAGTVRGARRSGARAATEISAVAEAGEKIAVIGAGAAGAEAARLLVEWGFEVVVVEARDRVGGRIHSIQSSNGPTAVELGAWRLDSAFDLEVVNDLASIGIDMAALDDSLFRGRDAEAATSEVGSDAVADAKEWAAKGLQDITLADALAESGAADRASDEGGDLDGEALLNQYLQALAVRTGADASEVSSWYGVPAEQAATVAVTGSFVSLIDAGFDGVRTFLNTVVVGVAYSDDSVSLRLGTGESLKVARAVVTVPLGVLKEDGIEFDPLLPFAHRTAIASLGNGTIETVWMRFDEKFWTTDAAVWQFVGTEAAITTWFNLEPSTGENILIGVVGGNNAAALAELDSDDLLQAARDSLRPMLAS